MKKIGEMLVEKGVITNEQLEKALKLQENNEVLLGEALITIGAITKTNLKNFLLSYKDKKEVLEWANSLLSQKEVDRIFKNK